MDLGALDSILNSFDAATAQWSASIAPYALTLFFYLASIEWGWTFITVLLSKRFAFEDVLRVVILKFLYLSFLFWLIGKSHVLLPMVVTSFQRVGGVAGGLTELHPSAFLAIGLRSAIAILSTLDVSGLLFDSFGRTVAVVGAFSALILFALIAASIMMTLIESFIVISGVAQFMLAFAATRWTFPLAQSALATVFRTGVKLMVTYLVASVFSILLTQWGDMIISSAILTPLDLLGFLGALVVSCILIFVLPGRLASYLVPPTLHLGLNPMVAPD
jgi:type IV secretion system protein TrbL